MSNSPSFVEHALDLLSGLGPVRARAMFGGHGLYSGDVMFGLLDDDELFLRPPDDAHEDGEAMLPWARLALAAAQRTRAAKARPPRSGG